MLGGLRSIVKPVIKFTKLLQKADADTHVVGRGLSFLRL